MKELIERIEGAEGPSWELDLAIVEWSIANRVTGLCGYEGVVNFHPPLWLDRYGPITASLDAALTLVPEGLGWAIMGGGAKVGRCFGIAATPALALAAAALKARGE